MGPWDASPQLWKTWGPKSPPSLVTVIYSLRSTFNFRHSNFLLVARLHSGGGPTVEAFGFKGNGNECNKRVSATAVAAGASIPMAQGGHVPQYL